MTRDERSYATMFLGVRYVLALVHMLGKKLRKDLCFKPSRTCTGRVGGARLGTIASLKSMRGVHCLARK